VDLNQLLFRHQIALIQAMDAPCPQSRGLALGCADFYAAQIEGCREGLIAPGAGGSLHAL
jgi:hypothetical protein